MRRHLRSKRAEFFKRVAAGSPRSDANLILLTHILPDRPEFVEAINHVASIARIVAVPYSIDSTSLEQLSANYEVVTPTLDTLEDPVAAAKLVESVGDGPIVICEVGGYFASALEHLDSRRASNLIGVVEDTEAGHRRYEKISLRWPVISVARSNLKECEDAVVGASCLFSLEKKVRQQGLVLENRRVLVLGYGRVGQGIARAFRARHCATAVYDTDAIRRCLAFSHGFQIPSRDSALRGADIILGATGKESVHGDDFEMLRHGVILSSCSSRNVEFDLPYLKSAYRREEISDGLQMFENKGNRVYLAAGGFPVNFLDGAVLGPLLALVQAEVIVALQKLLRADLGPGIHELDHDTRERLAAEWIDCFCDPEAGVLGRI